MSSNISSVPDAAADIRVGVHGAAGRMGRQLMAAVAERPGVVLGGAFERPGEPSVGVQAQVLVPELGAAAMGTGATAAADTIPVVTDSLDGAVGEVDVLVDFTRPEPSLALLAKAVDYRKPVVIGTTGFDRAGLDEVRAAATRIPVLQAANFSVGITLMLSLLREASAALGDEYDIEVIEAHHRHKVDAPSGTALALGQVIADATGRDLSRCAVYGREGHTGERARETIGFETIRGGDIIGEHTVLYAGDGERIELTHRATDRRVFARGAIRAAAWLALQQPGMYDMPDVLGIAST